MIEHYEFTLHLIESTYELKELDEPDYIRLLAVLLESDGEDLDQMYAINADLLECLANNKRQRISARLIIGAEKIEATEDPKERAWLMIHYNNLLKELGA